MDNHINRYIDESLIFFLSHSSKEDALAFLSRALSQKIAQKLASEDSLFSQKTIEKAIFQREKLMSTGIGMGIAIPHAKISGLSQFMLAIGIFEQGIDWNAIDSSLVRVVFMIIGPDSSPQEYLNLLSAITNAMRSEDARRKLMTAKSADIIVKTLSNP